MTRVCAIGRDSSSLQLSSGAMAAGLSKSGSSFSAYIMKLCIYLYVNSNKTILNSNKKSENHVQVKEGDVMEMSCNTKQQPAACLFTSVGLNSKMLSAYLTDSLQSSSRTNLS